MGFHWMDELSKGDGDESVSKRVVGSKLKIPEGVRAE